MFRILTITVGTVVIIIVNAVVTILPWALLAGFIYWLFF